MAKENEGTDRAAKKSPRKTLKEKRADKAGKREEKLQKELDIPKKP